MDQKSFSAPPTTTTTTFRNLRPRTVRGTAVTQRTQKRLQVGSDFDNLRRGRKKRSVSDKGKEEEEDDVEDYEDDDEDNNSHERLESISSSDDEDKVKPVASKETVTQMQFCRTAKVNIAYLDVLLKEAAHLRGQPHSKHSMERLVQVDQRIEHVSRALEDWGLPILQATQPVDHPVAPTVPEADGSEKRFTNVARAMGLDWSKVSSASASA